MHRTRENYLYNNLLDNEILIIFNKNLLNKNLHNNKLHNGLETRVHFLEVSLKFKYL